MNWIIVFLIAIISAILVLTTCGVGGGMMVLVILNGFSESAVNPFLIAFALIVFGSSIALSTSASWIFVKARHAESEIKFWHIAGINIGANALIILLIIAALIIRNLL